jgi:hypothetical protein
MSWDFAEEQGACHAYDLRAKKAPLTLVGG